MKMNIRVSSINQLYKVILWFNYNSMYELHYMNLMYNVTLPIKTL